MSIFPKKNPEQAALKVYDELCDNLVAVKRELGRAIAIESHIRRRLENNVDDTNKVGRALSGAEYEHATKDAEVLRKKLNSLYEENKLLSQDLSRANEKMDEMKKSYKELVDSIKDLQTRYRDMDLTISETKIQELANEAYKKKAEFDATYGEFEDEAYRKLFAAISERELDSKRVNDELTRKYLPEEK